MNSLVARKALTSDITNILKLQSFYLYRLNKSLNGKTGLINNEITSKELEQAIENDDCIVMVLEDNNTKMITAYALCYSFTCIFDQKTELIQELEKNMFLFEKQKSLLVEHIVVQSNNGAVKLLEALYNEGKDRFDHVYGEIMRYPIENIISKRFFTVLKGKIVGETRYDDNTIWNIVYSPVQNIPFRN